MMDPKDSELEAEANGEDGEALEDDPRSGDTGEVRHRLRGLLHNRRLFAAGIGVLTLLVLGGGALLWLLPALETTGTDQGGSGEALGSISTGPGSGRALLEQDLAPFFILLPEGRNNRMARLSLGVVWDGRASRRFSERRVEVRDMLFKGITKAASKSEDITKESVKLRSEARKVLQELIRPDEMRVVVKGVSLL